MDELISKSQRKRDAEALKKVGVAFIGLKLAELDLLPLTDELRRSIIDAKSITSNGAKRRQAQLIGKLMRSADTEAILEAYEQLQKEDSALTAHFHEMEVWRDRLIHEGKDALTQFIDRYSPDDVQHLRQLVKKAMDDKQKERNTGAAKTLFRYLRSVIK